jgi:hypothetical protein
MAQPIHAPAQWTNVGTGIDYRKFTLAGPNDVFVTRMAVANANCVIGSMIASNRVAGAREVVSSQALRYEDALNCWGGTWGQRNDVVVAVNGSFFNLTTGVITGGHIYDGWYSKRFDDWGGQTGFVWKFDRSYFIGVCPHYLANEQTVTVGGASRNFDGINVARGTDQLIIYTPQYDHNTLTASGGVEVVVQMSGPLMILDPPSVVSGTIAEVRVSQGATRIPFDCLVLSGAGTAATFLQNNAQVGQGVTISQNLRLYDGPTGGNICSIPDSRTFDHAYALTQGNFVFLKNGIIQPTTDAGMTNRNPRTAVAYNASYVFFMVCDGRTAQSIGMTTDEMGTFCRDTLGATGAVNMDGGGSSTMWINGVVKNHPSDAGVERAVANGLMMVNLAPKVMSSLYQPGGVATTISATGVRLGPGTDYYAFASLTNGAQGVFLSHGLNGIYAKGDYWWKCGFSGSTGWVAASSLAGPTLPSITRQPTNQTVSAGATCAFTVAAAGAGTLGYQWQKNQRDLTDGGSYAGCTTPALTISGASAQDSAAYRCVVTNTFGSATSRPAALIVGLNPFGVVSLTNLPPLAGDTTNEARAVTPDGQYVTGISGSRGFLYKVATGGAVNVLSSDGAQSTLASGVGYRTYNGQQELIVRGLTGSGNTDWMTTNGGTTWAGKRRDTTNGPSPWTVPPANAMSSSTTDVYYSVYRDNNNYLHVSKAWGAWPPASNTLTLIMDTKSVPAGESAAFNGVSATGRAVGKRGPRNYAMDWTGGGSGSVWFPTGLQNNQTGQVFAISYDGTILFGHSPVSGGRSGNWPYKALYSGTTLVSIRELPSFPDTAGSTSLGVPYGCTPDGKFAVGTDYRGAERAVLWNTSDSDPSRWSIVDLTDVAAASGILGTFSSLSRAYAVSTNAAGDLVVAGVGSDTNTLPIPRAFLMTLRPPLGSMSFPPSPTISGSHSEGFTLAFMGASGTNITYYLESTTNLTQSSSWITIGSTPGTGSLTTLSDPNPGDRQRFYRIRVQ